MRFIKKFLLKIRLMINKTQIAIDYSNGSDYETRIYYKIIGGKVYIVSCDIVKHKESTDVK